MGIWGGGGTQDANEVKLLDPQKSPVVLKLDTKKSIGERVPFFRHKNENTEFRF